jgi:TIR domain-containing protein
MANEVFLSYTRIKEGKEHLITQFHDELQQKLQMKTRPTITIFLDTENLTPGAKWSDELKATLDKAKIFLFLLSQTWIESEWCVKEYNYFVNSMRGNPNKALLPVLWARVRDDFFTDKEKKLFKKVSRYQRAGKNVNYERLGSFSSASPDANQAILDLADEIADKLQSLLPKQSS